MRLESEDMQNTKKMMLIQESDDITNHSKMSKKNPNAADQSAKIKDDLSGHASKSHLSKFSHDRSKPNTVGPTAKESCNNRE
jgi:hypothetical protein